MKTINKGPSANAKAEFMSLIVPPFLRAALMGSKSFLTLKSFNWIPLARVPEADDDVWYQTHYFRRLKFKSDFLDEDIIYFERRVHDSSYPGQVWVLNFKKWNLVILSVLRTFEKKKKKRRKRRIGNNHPAAISTLPPLRPSSQLSTKLPLYTF